MVATCAVPQNPQIWLEYLRYCCDEFLQLTSRIRAPADRVTLYASSYDIAISLSKKFHTYPPAGESGEDIVVVKGLDTVDASSVDTSVTGHSTTPKKERCFRIFSICRKTVRRRAGDMASSAENVRRGSTGPFDHEDLLLFTVGLSR